MGGDKIVLLDGAGANGGGIYDHYGMHEKMKEMEERENELEERERRWSTSMDPRGSGSSRK